MVVNYLENLLEERLEEKINLEQKKQKLKRKIDTDIRLLEELQAKKNQKNEPMSPRKERKETEQSRLSSIQSSLKENQLKLDEILVQCSGVEGSIDELRSVIKIAKNTKSQFEDHPKEFDELFRMKALETQEAERQRIARDLHDSTVQSLTGIIYKSELAYKLIDLDPIRCKLELNSISSSLKEVTEEMRHLIFNLRPMSFDDMGLEVSIERVLSRLTGNSRVNVKFQCSGEAYEINPVIAITLLRIIQEACNNAMKYAKCDFFRVQIEYLPDCLRLSIQDDGIGFSYDEVKMEVREDHTGVGLSSINERVYLLSGKIRIDTQPEKGTKIEIEIPIS